MLKLVFAGTPDVAVPSLQAFAADSRFEVVGVITRPDAPTGRRWNTEQDWSCFYHWNTRIESQISSSNWSKDVITRNQIFIDVFDHDSVTTHIITTV